MVDETAKGEDVNILEKDKLISGEELTSEEIPQKYTTEFENAIQSHEFRGMKVLNEVSVDGSKAIVVEIGNGTGKITLALKPEGIVGVKSEVAEPDVVYSQGTEEEFNAILEAKEYQGHKVLGEIDYGGRRAMEVEFPEGKVTFVLGVEGIINDILPPDEDLDLVDKVSLRGWLEEQLRAMETVDQPIKERSKEDLQNTIANIKKWKSGAVVEPTFKSELRDIALARMGYHNLAFAARLGMKNLENEFVQITQDQSELILVKTAGVKEAIKMITDKEGAIFRMESDKRKKEEQRIRNELRRRGIGNPTFRGLPAADEAKAEDEAKVALELAIKAMHAFGESGYYDGIKVIPGTIFKDKDGHVIPTPSMGSDGFISVKVLEELYSSIIPNGEFAIERRYAKFIEEYKENIAFYKYKDGGVIKFSNKRETIPTGSAGIEWNLLNNVGALHGRATYYWPIALENPQTPDQGRAVSLRKYMYTWINSGVRFMRDADDDTVKSNLSEFVDDFGHDYAKYYIWVNRAARAYSARGVLNEKGPDSVINMPLIEPNSLLFKDDDSAIDSVMGNFEKSAQAYEHLPTDQRQVAMAELLKGVLTYGSWRNVHIANRELETRWAGLSDKNMEDIIRRVVKKNIITEDQGVEVYKATKVSSLGAVGEEAGERAARGIWGTIQAAFNAATK